MVNASYGAEHQWGPPPPKSFDPGRIESGSLRSYTGIAAAIAGAALVTTGFLPWGIASLRDGAGAAQFALNGFGQLAYQPSARDRNPGAQLLADTLNRAGMMASPGLGAALLGAVGLAAALVFLSSQKRSAAAVVMIAVGLMASIASLAQIANVRGMFDGSTDLAGAHFAPGFGVIVAVFAALALSALGITAFVLERGAIVRRARIVPPPAEHPASAPAPAPSMQPPPAAPGLSSSPVPGAPAEVWSRLIAGAIDIAIAALAAIAVGALAVTTAEFATASSPARVIWSLLTLLLVGAIPLGYFTASEARSGLTLGKRITGIVVQGPAGLAPSLRESFRRNAAHAVLGLALGLMCGAMILSFAILPSLLVAPLLLAYLAWLGVMATSAFSNPGGNPWRLGAHDRFAQGPTRVVNRSALPLAPASAVPLAPWWAAAAAVALLMCLTGIADTSLRVMSPGKSTSVAATPSTHTVTVQVPTPEATRQPTASPHPRPQTPTAFPADATRCPPRYGPTGAYTESAVANDHTSCPFAEEVRIAYADMGMPGSFQRLIVNSPVTRTSIEMTCGPAVAGFIVCRGGNDAVVYVN
ncbi:RDD family protein [Mycolicibacter sinensis]